jgi:hypothetical protein
MVVEKQKPTGRILSAPIRNSFRYSPVSTSAIPEPGVTFPPLWTSHVAKTPSCMVGLNEGILKITWEGKEPIALARSSRCGEGVAASKRPNAMRVRRTADILWRYES